MVWSHGEVMRSHSAKQSHESAVAIAHTTCQVAVLGHAVDAPRQVLRSAPGMLGGSLVPTSLKDVAMASAWLFAFDGCQTLCVREVRGVVLVTVPRQARWLQLRRADGASATCEPSKVRCGLMEF